MKKYKINLTTGKIHREQPTEQCNTDDGKRVKTVDQNYIDALTNPDWCGYCYSPKYARLRGEKP